jgi:predicted membrane protein
MDLDDVVEAAVDIEDIAEEVAEPEDLIEDFVESPAVVLVGLFAAGAAVFTLLMLVLAIVAAFAFGFLWVLVIFALLGLFATIGAIAVFLYVRTDIQSDVRRRIEDAREQADDSPKADARMTEEEAIEELRELYATGEIDDHELDEALEAALTSDDPERVVRKYERRSESRVREYE